MARVLVVTFTDIVRDPRVRRHIDALRTAFDVVSCGKGDVPPGVVEHHQIPSEAEHLPMTPLGLAGLAVRRSEMAYSHLPAAAEAIRLCQDVEFDVALSNDISSLPATWRLAGSRPLIADMHEYAPKEMEENLRWRLMVQPYATELCRNYLPRASLVTTVAEGIADEYRAEFGVRAETITNAAAYRGPPVRAAGTPTRLVHSGMAIPNRQLEVMIEAASGLPNVTLDLYLVPSIRAKAYLAKLRRRAASTPNVVVREPVPMADLPAALDAYDVGLHLLAPTSFNNEHALPNKFFDFVQSGLGIVIGPSPEMASLTRKYGLGQVLSDFEPDTLRSALRNMTSEVASGWKVASCAAARDLSSEAEESKLVSLVHEVLAREAG